MCRLFGDPSSVPYGKYFCLGYYNQYPAARGHVHATHKDDVLAPTDFRPGFLEEYVWLCFLRLHR